VLQRTATWWPDPDRFDPDRFDPGRLERAAVGGEPAAAPRFAYIPFGAGPNLCIGRDLALMESVLLVATVARNWTLEPLPGHEVRADPLVTIRPRGGLPMVLRRRSA